MIKAVFFDIDGTLISFNTHRMPESTRTALQLLRQNGIKVFVATGRAPNGTGFLEEYFDFDGFISFNGQYCFNRNGVIHQNPISVEALQSAVSFLTENNIASSFESLNRKVFNLVNDRVYGLMSLVGVSDFNPICEDASLITEEIYQLTVYVTVEEEDRLMPLMPECKALRWYPTFVDVVDKNGGKSVGIEKMGAYYGFSQNEVMAFGDGGNDIDMLEYAGIGVAMGNAADNVKKASDYVTDDIDADGIYNALKKFGLI